MSQSNDDQVPYVLALTIIAPGGPSIGDVGKDRVLYCVRDRATNVTHPDVVSVPTQRIPHSVGDELVQRGRDAGKSGETVLLSSTKMSSEEMNGHDPLIYTAESLLSRKMGVADELESNRLAFEVELGGFHQGKAKYQLGTGPNTDIDEYEELRMVNLVVTILGGIELFPGATPSYVHQQWTSVANFKAMWDGRDATKIGLGADRTPCVDGLCIASTHDILVARYS